MAMMLSSCREGTTRLPGVEKSGTDGGGVAWLLLGGLGLGGVNSAAIFRRIQDPTLQGRDSDEKNRRLEEPP